MIKIDKDQLLQDKADLDQAKTEFDDIVTKMEAIVNRLPESWEGQSATAYVEQFVEIKNNVLTNVSEVINGISGQIKQVCENADEFDGTMADQIK